MRITFRGLTCTYATLRTDNCLNQMTVKHGFHDPLTQDVINNC